MSADNAETIVCLVVIAAGAFVVLGLIWIAEQWHKAGRQVDAILKSIEDKPK